MGENILISVHEGQIQFLQLVMYAQKNNIHNTQAYIVIWIKPIQTAPVRYVPLVEREVPAAGGILFYSRLE